MVRTRSLPTLDCPLERMKVKAAGSDCRKDSKSWMGMNLKQELVYLTS